MIPSSVSAPFGRPSPRLQDVDLARLIDRTIALAVAAHHEQGFATVSYSCDGRKRTTLFDGSACQTDGEVCIAQRQDGISSCIDAPMQGTGLITRHVVFQAVACAPVTGWYLLDDEGYLYKIPAALLDAVAYWPVADTPGPTRYDLVRSGTWDRLMCAAALAPPTLNGDGGCLWQTYSIDGETVASTIQYFYAHLGGLLTHLIAVPSISSVGGTVTVGAFSGRWRGGFSEKAIATNVFISTTDGGGHSLTAGQEYKAIVYAFGFTGSTAVVATLKGNWAVAGGAVLPTLTSPVHIPLAYVTVPFSGVVVPVAVGTTTPINWEDVRELTSDPVGARGALWGIIVRDIDDPNAGVRKLTVTLPSAGSGVVTGDVRIGFGFPIAFEYLFEPGGDSPYGFVGEATPAEIATRTDYDMACVYGPPRLAIEYSPYHINVAGADIEQPADWTVLSTEIASDIVSNIVQLPNGEVCLSKALTDGGTPMIPQIFDRFRVRPAPDTAPTITLAQQAIAEWGTDPNVWTSWSSMSLAAWTPGDTTLTKAIPGSWTHGHAVPCIVWQYSSGQQHWTLDAAAKTGTLGEPSGSTCPVTFDLGGGCPALQVGKTQVVSFLGPYLVLQYGWTFTCDGIESALSPLTEPFTVPATSSIYTATYSLTVGVPVGPTGTTERTIYRFVYDRNNYRYDPGTGLVRYYAPWAADSEVAGAVYDRMLSSVGSLPDNVSTEWVDENTSLSFAGTRPPSPFIGPVGAGITLDTMRRVFALPPLNL